MHMQGPLESIVIITAIGERRRGSVVPIRKDFAYLAAWHCTISPLTSDDSICLHYLCSANG